MRTSHPRWAFLVLAFTLLAAACSGGGESEPPVYTVPPGFGDDADSPATDTTTSTIAATGHADPASAIVAYWEAVAAYDWETAYSTASPQFADDCVYSLYETVAEGVTGEPTTLEFSAIDLSVINDLGFGQFSYNDGVGVIPIEGLLAVRFDSVWFAYANPCHALERAATTGPSYPMVIIVEDPTPTDNPTDDAPIPDSATTTTTTPPSSTTTLLTDPPSETPTTTTTLPPVVPLSAADEAEIELIVRQFVQSEAKQDWAVMYDSVPPLFGGVCTAEEIATAQAPYHYSPTDVTFGEFTIEGNDDEAFASFEVSYADTGETVSVSEFGAWEWGGVWYAAVEPCLYSDLLEANGLANDTAMGNLHSALALARELYEDAGDYDIPIPTLEALEPGFPWVASSNLAEGGAVAYVNDGQKLLLVSQSVSGRWYCIAEEAGQPAVYSSGAFAATVDTFEGCKSVSLSNPWGPPA